MPQSPLGDLFSSLRELLALTGPYRRNVLGLFVVAAVVYVALLTGHSVTRKPWNDEAMSALAGYNLGFQGHTGVSFFDEQESGYVGVSRHSYYIFPLQLCVFAVWYHIAGFSLLSTRILAMLWSFVGLGVLFYLLRRLTRDPLIAFVGTALTALDYQFMSAASFGRYDSMVAGLGFGGYALFLGLRERSLRLALFAANAAVAASGATHPNGIFYFLGLWILILYFDRSRIGWRDLAAAAAPYAVGGLIWARFILEDLPSFRAQLSRNSTTRVGLLQPVTTLLFEIKTRYIAAYGLGAHSVGHESPIVRLKAISLVAYLAGIAGCFAVREIRTNTLYRPLFLLAGLHWFMMTFYENMKFSYYMVHLVPFYWALAAIVAVTLWRRSHALKWGFAALLVAAAAIQTGGIAAKIRLNDYGHSYAPAVDYVRKHASPQDEVMAACSFGFGLGFTPRLIDDDSLGYYSRRRPAFIVLEEIYDYEHNYYKTARPELYAHIQELMRSYELAYSNNEYRVYRRKPSEDGQT